MPSRHRAPSAPWSQGWLLAAAAVVGGPRWYRGSFSGGCADPDGFSPGAVIWGRVRKVGTGGQVGNWSDPAQHRAR